MIKSIRHCIGTQHMSHIKSLPAFEPLGVICIDWETWWGVDHLMNLLRAHTHVSECTTFVESPAVNMILVMQLVEHFEPIVQVRMSPAGLDNSICWLTCVAIKGRLIRQHSIHSQCV